METPGSIAEFYERHGLEGLRRLATGARTDLSYIRALLYSPTKNPSLKMAIDLVRASDSELTFEGLAFPKGRGDDVVDATQTAALVTA
jgi:hypothetical protein